MDIQRIKKSVNKIIQKVDHFRSSRGRMEATEVLILSDIRYAAHEILQELEPKDKNEQKSDYDQSK